MAKIYTESKMDFDYSVSTEDRFALRKWFEAFVVAKNEHGVEEQKGYLSEKLIAEGFTEAVVGKQAFLDFLAEQKHNGSLLQIRFPEMKIKYKNESYLFSGTFEGYSADLLSYEGTIEVEVIKEDNKFAIDYIKFYPRLKLAI